MTTFNFRVKITIGTGIVLAILGGAVVTVYAKHADENLRKILEFGTTVAATVAGLTGASYAAQNLTRSAEETKIDRTLAFISRWNDPGFEKKLVIQLLRQVHDKPPSAVKEFIVSEIDKNNDLKAQVTTILNFFEEMALAINSKLVDENTLRDFFKSLVLTHVENFYPWIDRRRNNSNKSKKVFQSLTELHQRWQDGNGNGN